MSPAMRLASISPPPHAVALTAWPSGESCVAASNLAGQAARRSPPRAGDIAWWSTSTGASRSGPRRPELLLAGQAVQRFAHVAQGRASHPGERGALAARRRRPPQLAAVWARERPHPHAARAGARQRGARVARRARREGASSCPRRDRRPPCNSHHGSWWTSRILAGRRARADDPGSVPHARRRQGRGPARAREKMLKDRGARARVSTSGWAEECRYRASAKNEEVRARRGARAGEALQALAARVAGAGKCRKRARQSSTGLESGWEAQARRRGRASRGRWRSSRRRALAIAQEYQPEMRGAPWRSASRSTAMGARLKAIERQIAWRAPRHEAFKRLTGGELHPGGANRGPCQRGGCIGSRRRRRDRHLQLRPVVDSRAARCGRGGEPQGRRAGDHRGEGVLGTWRCDPVARRCWNGRAALARRARLSGREQAQASDRIRQPGMRRKPRPPARAPCSENAAPGSRRTRHTLRCEPGGEESGQGPRRTRTSPPSRPKRCRSRRECQQL